MVRMKLGYFYAWQVGRILHCGNAALETTKFVSWITF
jgi:hypothetical protein